MNKLITSAQAAKQLGFSADYIRHLILEGKIKAEKIGRNWVLYPSAIKNIKRVRSRKVKD